MKLMLNKVFSDINLNLLYTTDEVLRIYIRTTYFYSDLKFTARLSHAWI